jgi:K+-sensing histidine kinase KdpD
MGQMMTYLNEKDYASIVKGEAMTKIFEKILIATDGSMKNQPAVSKGLELAREFGSVISAIYVIDETPFTSAQQKY